VRNWVSRGYLAGHALAAERGDQPGAHDRSDPGRAGGHRGLPPLAGGVRGQFDGGAGTTNAWGMRDDEVDWTDLDGALEKIDPERTVAYAFAHQADPEKFRLEMAQVRAAIEQRFVLVREAETEGSEAHLTASA
jgi:hypothetical protein